LFVFFCIFAATKTLKERFLTMKNKSVILETSAIDRASGREFRFALEFYVFMQSGKYIAYCPSLDLSSSAESFNDAVSSFYEAFQLYVETCVEMGTLQQDLLGHGWKIKKNGVTPPKFTMLFKKPEMKRLLEGNVNYERLVTPVRIPAFS